MGKTKVIDMMEWKDRHHRKGSIFERIGDSLGKLLLSLGKTERHDRTY